MKPFVPTFYICHPKKYIYIKNPKCACSSVLTQMYDWGHIDKKPVHSKQHNEVNMRMKEGFRPDYFKFSFVRNPWSRFVSLFQDKTKTIIGTKWEMRKWRKYKDYNFEQFAREMSKRNVNAIDRHSRFQYINLNRNVGLDFYGRVESFNEDMSSVAKKIGLDIADVPWVNKQASIKDYRDYYNKETIKIVGDIYKKDIDVFGYTFDGQKW